MTGLESLFIASMVGTPAAAGALSSGALLSSTAAGAATSGLIGAGGSVSLGALLSTGTTLASAGMSLFGGNAQADFAQEQANAQAQALEFQTRQEELQARQEEILGMQEANDILEQTLRVRASQRLAFSANGVAGDAGTPVSTDEATRRAADLQLGTSRLNTRQRVLARRSQANQFRIERAAVQRRGASSASSSRLSGIKTAAGTLAGFADRRIGRG